MLSALILFVNATTQTAPPLLPVGASPRLSEAVDRIAKLTEAGDFIGAKAALRLLPAKTVRVQWDDSGVAEGFRPDYARVRDSVLSDWERLATAAKYQVVEKGGDLAVVFTTKEAGETIWSEKPGEPRLTLRVRLNQEGQIDPSVLNNQFSYAVGSYLGLPRIPFNGLLMAGTELSQPQALKPSVMECTTANSIITACDRIRIDVNSSKVLKSGLPSLAETPKPLQLGKVLQGTRIPIELSVRNAGEGTLIYRIVPDCSCFSKPVPQQVAAGDSGTSKLDMDTTEFGGTVHKVLFIFSNDRTEPIRAVPLEVDITPRYRVLPPSRVIVADSDTVTLEAYLYAPADHPLKVRDAESQGLPGEVKFEKWEGSLADPDLGEGELPRKGYKITLKLQNIPEGSQFGTNISISTDDPAFSRINYPVFVQKGIVAFPSSLFLGEVGPVARKLTVTLARPGKPFNITAIESSSENLKAVAEPAKVKDAVKPGEFKLSVLYDGKAAKGDYSATITIRTDDPKQPVIVIPVSASVR